jgi:Na+-transporting methylmalonyl-CoA/oxaloacetate decarboxylase gamma subunit
MIDWGLVAKIAGGGFGSTLLVLAIICTVIWLIGLVVQKRAPRNKD